MHEEGQAPADNAEGCIHDGMKRGDAIRGGLCISHARRTPYTSDLYNTAGRQGATRTRSAGSCRHTGSAANIRRQQPIICRQAGACSGGHIKHKPRTAHMLHKRFLQRSGQSRHNRHAIHARQQGADNIRQQRATICRALQTIRAAAVSRLHT